ETGEVTAGARAAPPRPPRPPPAFCPQASIPPASRAMVILRLGRVIFLPEEFQTHLSDAPRLGAGEAAEIRALRLFAESIYQATEWGGNAGLLACLCLGRWQSQLKLRLPSPSCRSARPHETPAPELSRSAAGDRRSPDCCHRRQRDCARHARDD